MTAAGLEPEAAEVTQRAGSSTTLGFEDAQKMVKGHWRCWRIWTTRRTSTQRRHFRRYPGET